MTARKQRIGCIVPAINLVAEEDFVTLCPAGAGVHFTRADVDRDRPMTEQFQQMVDAAPNLAAILAKAGMDVIAFACTSASFFRGPGMDAELAKAMTEACGVPAVTTSTAVLGALQALEAGRIAVATPYKPWVCEAEREFLAAGGHEVLDIVGLGREGGADINTISRNEILRLAREVDRPEANVLFVSCTDLPVLALIEEIETDLGKPVVTSNQATFWACAKATSLGPINGYGRLLAHHLPA